MKKISASSNALKQVLIEPFPGGVILLQLTGEQENQNIIVHNKNKIDMK